ncbi:MAG: hypothetical protein OXC14_08885 [Rhodospirillaceae bacterium]|nr:hypothetical protein [Rhodospirillaceae bacterium]
MTFTVFYAWQSDRDASLCKNLIREALDKAAVELVQELGIDVVIDQDTQDVPGSPSIPDTILAKIAAIEAVVADLTLTHTNDRQGGSKKRSSNPNVMLEYGYALRAADHNLLGVINTAFGRPEDLPFDLRHKRCITYCAGEDDDLDDVRQQLSRELAEALRPILRAKDDPPTRPDPWNGEFVNDDKKTPVTLAPGPALYLNCEPHVEEEPSPLELPMDMLRNIVRGLRPLAPPDLLPEHTARLRGSGVLGVFHPDPAAPERALAASLVTRQGSFHGVWCSCAESPEVGQAGWVNEDRLTATLDAGLTCYRAAGEGAGLVPDIHFSSRCSEVRVRLDGLRGLSLMLSGGSVAGPLLVGYVEAADEGGLALRPFFDDLRVAAGEDDKAALPRVLRAPSTWPARRVRF